MQFLPSTFADYGGDGDILSPHDSIMAAGRYLAANGFAEDHDRALPDPGRGGMGGISKQDKPALAPPR